MLESCFDPTHPFVPSLVNGRTIALIPFLETFNISLPDSIGAILLTTLVCAFFFAGRAIFAMMVYGDVGFAQKYAFGFMSVSEDLPPEEKVWEITMITSGGQSRDTTNSAADWNAFMQSEVEKACELSLEQSSASIFVDQIMELLNNKITDNLAKQVVAAAGGGGDAALEEAQAIISHGKGFTEEERQDWKRSLLRVKGMRKRQVTVRDVDGASTKSQQGEGLSKVPAPGERVTFTMRGYTVARGLDGWPWEYLEVPENVFAASSGSVVGEDQEGGPFVESGTSLGAAVEESKDGVEKMAVERSASVVANDFEEASKSDEARAVKEDNYRNRTEVEDRDDEDLDQESTAENLESNDESGTEAIAESMISLW